MKKSKKREKLQRQFSRGGKIGEIKIGPFTFGRVEELERRIDEADPQPDASKTVIAAFYIYAHKVPEVRALGDSEFWQAVQDWGDEVHMNDVAEFGAIFAKDMGATEASEFQPIEESGKSQEPAPRDNRSSSGQGSKLATANVK